MIVLVCGGRRFRNNKAVESYLDMLHAIYKFTLVIHGNAPGADWLADCWAISRHVDYKRFPADWNRLGKPAGIIRNRQMLVEGQPQLVVAFPGGTGTNNMKQQARDAGVNVIDLGLERVRIEVRERYRALKDGNAAPAIG